MLFAHLRRTTWESLRHMYLLKINGKTILELERRVRAHEVFILQWRDGKIFIKLHH